MSTDLGLLPVTSSNSTTGAGAIDSWHSVVTECENIKNEHGSDRAATAVEIGVSVVGAVLDTVAFALDPFAKLVGAGLGWLIEHIGFLKKGLDELAGNPDAIKEMANEMHATAQKLRDAATDFDSQLAKISGWTGQAADKFRSTMDGHKGNIDATGHSVDIIGYVLETTMALVAAVRALVRDTITTVLGDIIVTMTIALASAVFTFGASLVAGTAKCVAEAAVEAADTAAKVDKLSIFAGRAGKRCHDLIASLKNGKTSNETSSTGGHELDDMSHGGSSSNTPHDPATSGDEAGHGNGFGGDDTAPHSTNPTGPNEQPATTGSSASHGDDAPASTNPTGPNEQPTTTGGSASHGDDAPASTTPSSSHSDDPGSSGTPHDDDPGHTSPSSTNPEDDWEGDIIDSYGGGSSHHDDEPTTPSSTSSNDDWEGDIIDSYGGASHHGDGETTPSSANPNSNWEGDLIDSYGAGTHAPPSTGRPLNSIPEEPEPHSPTESSSGGSHDDGPVTTSKPPKNDSNLKPYDIKFMKAHEEWLKGFAGNSYDKMKWFDNWLKNNPKYGQYYPVIKALSDAKSSKNWIGWIDKNAITFDKAITDIHSQAEQAWQQQEQQDQAGQATSSTAGG